MVKSLIIVSVYTQQDANLKNKKEQNQLMEFCKCNYFDILASSDGRQKQKDIIERNEHLT
jgi:hypothetical protein